MYFFGMMIILYYPLCKIILSQDNDNKINEKRKTINATFLLIESIQYLKIVLAIPPFIWLPAEFLFLVLYKKKLCCQEPHDDSANVNPAFTNKHYQHFHFRIMEPSHFPQNRRYLRSTRIILSRRRPNAVYSRYIKDLPRLL